jgi:transposase InsO family protein
VSTFRNGEAIPEAKSKEEWQLDYNHERPYEVLGFVPPAEYS